MCSPGPTDSPSALPLVPPTISPEPPHLWLPCFSPWEATAGAWRVEVRETGDLLPPLPCRARLHPPLVRWHSPQSLRPQGPGQGCLTALQALTAPTIVGSGCFITPESIIKLTSIRILRGTLAETPLEGGSCPKELCVVSPIIPPLPSPCSPRPCPVDTVDQGWEESRMIKLVPSREEFSTHWSLQISRAST